MSHTRRKRLAEINVVPYIDVMLVLLIIFMVTAPMLTQGVKVSLPEVSNKQAVTSDNLPLIVTVDKEGHYYLNAEHEGRVALDLSTIALRVKAFIRIAKAEGKAKPVLVKGDKEASYQKIVSLMASLNAIGVKQVGLLTSSPTIQPIKQV